MADIITRLLLKTDDFDANLNRSKQSVNSFQGGISDMAKTAGAGVAKFAGAIGLAVGAGEGFMKVIRGSQSTSDEFDNVINTCTSTVNSFFTALSTGDFSAFNQGLSDMMSKAYAASAALDQLGNTRMAYNYFGSGTQTKIAESALIAMDKSLPKEERQKGLVDWKSALDEKKGYSTAMKDDALDALKKIIVEGTVLNSDNVTLKDFENITKLDLYNPAIRDKEKDKLDKFFSQYQAQMKDLEKQRQSGGVADWAFPESAGAKERASQNATIDKAQEKLNERFKESILYKKILDKWSDEELQSAFNLASEYQRVNEELAIQERTYNKARDKVNKEGDAGGKGKKKDNPLAGSLAYFDAEIAKSNASLIKSTDAQARAAIQATINELEKQKIELLITEKGDSLDALSLRIGKLKTEFSTATTDEARKEIHKLIKELESMQLKINLTAKYDESKASLKKAGLPTSGLDTKKMKLPKHVSLISKKDIDLNNQYNESLYAMGGLLNSVSGSFDGNTASVLQWGASLLGTISQAIPAIIGMSGVKAADTIVTNANTTAEVTNAGAKAISAHAGIPFAGVALGIAGVAAIVAAMASMPKFATGGIVGGSSFTGDNVLARVNSGEMILNAGQQANLFGMLNGINRPERPTLGNIAQIIQSPDQKEVQVTGNFRVKGSDLELALKNQTNKKSKIR